MYWFSNSVRGIAGVVAKRLGLARGFMSVFEQRCACGVAYLRKQEQQARERCNLEVGKLVARRAIVQPALSKPEMARAKTARRHFRSTLEFKWISSRSLPLTANALPSTPHTYELRFLLRLGGKDVTLLGNRQLEAVVTRGMEDRFF